jgi:hypothetical protein
MTNLPPKPKHLDVQIEGDLVIARTSGAMDASVARYLGAVHDELELEFGYGLGLIECRQGFALTLEARQAYFQRGRKRQYPGAAAVVGANFATKTMAMLLTRAINLVGTRYAAMNFFDTEAEARVWLDQQRIVMKNLLSSKKAP